MNTVTKGSAGKLADTMTFILTTETADRVGDVVVLKGLDLKNFKANPVALVHHRMGDFPVGIWKNIRQHGDALLADLHLASKGTSSMADLARNLIEQGILKAVSITFRPTKAEPIVPRGMKFFESELLEASLVSVPMNPRAVMVAKSLGMSDDQIAEFFDEPSSAVGKHAKSGDPQEAITRAKGAILGVNRYVYGVRQ
jgi:hypothetical protein